MVTAEQVAGQVRDPELPMLTLRDLGVLRDVRVEDGTVTVEITPTYSGCPAIAEMRTDLDRALRSAGFASVDVRTVLSPPWSSDDITEHGRRVLAENGIAPPGPAPRRASGPIPLTLGTRPTLACPRCASTDTERVSQFGSTACKALYRCRACAEPFEHLKAI